MHWHFLITFSPALSYSIHAFFLSSFSLEISCLSLLHLSPPWALPSLNEQPAFLCSIVKAVLFFKIWPSPFSFFFFFFQSLRERKRERVTNPNSFLFLLPLLLFFWLNGNWILTCFSESGWKQGWMAGWAEKGCFSWKRTERKRDLELYHTVLAIGCKNKPLNSEQQLVIVWVVQYLVYIFRSTNVRAPCYWILRQSINWILCLTAK